MLSFEVGCMDIGRIQPAGTAAVGYVSDQPGLRDTAPSQRELIQAVKALNGSELFGDNRELTFVFDRKTHRALARIVDKQTREVIVQLPPEQVLQMAQERK